MARLYLPFIVCVTASIALVMHAPFAYATAQAPEQISDNGHRGDLYSTPLAPLLESRKDLDALRSASSSGLWRGYVGHWSIVGDKLYLAGLATDDYGEGAQPIREGALWKHLFGKRRERVLASWYSGTLRIDRSFARRRVNQGQASFGTHEQHVTIRKGVVVSRRMVDMFDVTRGRSESDLKHLGILSTVRVRKAPDPGDHWLDGRIVAQATFHKQRKPKEPFITRGLLQHDDEGRIVLHIPGSLVTPPASMRIHESESPLPKEEELLWVHAEVQAHWEVRDGTPGLVLTWWRKLADGDTIHRPDHPLPPLPSPLRRVAYTPLECKDSDHEAVGDEIWSSLRLRDLEEVEGRLRARDGALTVEGVEVAANPAWVGKVVRARGLVQRWELTAELLALNLPSLQEFQGRKAGTYMRLIDPKNQQLVQAAVVSGYDD